MGHPRSGIERALADQLTFGPEREPVPDDFSGLNRHPLYFALSRPIGTHTASVTDALKEKLGAAGYYVKNVKLSRLIAKAYLELTGFSLPKTEKDGQRDYSSYRSLMRAGDMLRVIDRAMVAELAVLEINRNREQDIQDAILAGKTGVAYIVTHLMHPDEVRTLRSVYGARFFLIAANAPRIKRQQYIVSEFEKIVSRGPQLARVQTDVGSEPTSPARTESDAAQLGAELIAIDAGVKSSMHQLDPKGRLNVDDTFKLADLFVRSRSEGGENGRTRDVDTRAKEQVSRFIAQIFSNPFGTPTAEESAMATAFLAAKSSVSLGRSVGAALVDKSGSVLATGWNEVAKPFGGPYREDDLPDYRDHINGFDPSDASRVHAIRTFLEILLSPEHWKDALPELRKNYSESADWLEAILERVPPEGLGPSDQAIVGLAALEAFDKTRIMHLIEFGRSVHAEVATLSDAFRKGVHAREPSMYVTTFPCHECTRNLISFGVKQVFFVEPYGKSMAEWLYKQEISVFPDDLEVGERIAFIPFAGIAPSRLDALFASVPRKYGLSDGPSPKGVGAAIEWKLSTAPIRGTFVGYPPGYSSALLVPEFEVAMLRIERIVAASVSEKISAATYKLRDPDGNSPISE
ncbi:hypothetical protein ACLBXX_02845 [Microbacterium sp. C23T]